MPPANISKVSCADPRATPEDYFQLKAGGTKSPHLDHLMFKTDAETEVIVLRNIGGRTVPALENILVLDSFVHVSDIIVVHHTGIPRLV